MKYIKHASNLISPSSVGPIGGGGIHVPLPTGGGH